MDWQNISKPTSRVSIDLAASMLVHPLASMAPKPPHLGSRGTEVWAWRRASLAAAATYRQRVTAAAALD